MLRFLPVGRSNAETGMVSLGNPVQISFDPVRVHRSSYLGLLLVVALTGIVWTQVTPRRAWKGIVRAAISSNDAELMMRIDPGMLASNLHQDLLRSLRSQAGIPMDTPESESESGLINSLVATAITPAGMKETLRSFQIDKTGAETSWRYRSPREVEVILRPPGAAAAEAGHFTLRYTGSAWRLIRVRSAWLVGQEQT